MGKSARVCSLNFVDGKKSENCGNEASNPTIFPWTKKIISAVHQAERHKRRLENFTIEKFSSDN